MKYYNEKSIYNDNGRILSILFISTLREVLTELDPELEEIREMELVCLEAVNVLFAEFRLRKQMKLAKAKSNEKE